jgi:biotin carboxylase
VFVLEIGARMGATCLPENLSAYTGVDLYGHVIEAALGAAAPFAPDPMGVATASILLQAPASGVLSGVDLPEKLLQSEQVYEWCVDSTLGERVRRFTTGPDRIGHVVTVARTADTAIQEATRLASEFRFTVESASDESSDRVGQPAQSPAGVLRGGQWLRPERLRAA